MSALAGRPTPQVVAQLSQRYLEESLEALERIGTGRNPEALHDARVGVRRLRCLLRAYRTECEEYLPGKVERQMRCLMRMSNQARDRDVQLAWLQRQASGLRPSQQAGYDWLLHRLQAQGEAELVAELGKGLASLRRRLAKPLQRLANAPGQAFAQVTGHHAAELMAVVMRALTAVTDSGDVHAAHIARIKVKRLRYLLNPLREESSACAEAAQHLQRLQDLLGEVHDRQVMMQLLRQSLAQAAALQAATAFDEAMQGTAVRASAWQAPAAAGLLALAKRNRMDLSRDFNRLQDEYLGQISALGEVLARAVSEIEAPVHS